jgi:DNA modification methylase
MGSGTTNIVAQKMSRNSIGIEIMPEYYQKVKREILPVHYILFEPESAYEKT